MMKTNTIVSKPGFLTVSFCENPSLLYFDWENIGISLDDCVEAFALAEKAMVERGVFSIVSDVVKVKEGLRPEVAQWWGAVCLPSLAKTGVKLIVNLLPASTDRQSDEEEPPEVVNTIVMKKASSVAVAEDLVRNFSKKSIL